MIRLNSVLLLLTFTILNACNTPESNSNKNEISGIWIRDGESNNGLEMTKDGEYYILLNGERMQIDTPTAMSYKYSPEEKEENNFKIYASNNSDIVTGIVSFINKDQIIITLTNQGNPDFKTTFNRAKNNNI